MAEGKLSKESNSNVESTDRKKNSGVDVSESERELAQGALAEFSKTNFSAASALLVKLISSRSKDIKALSNKAVIDYYNSGMKKTEAFQKSLFDICCQCGINLDEIKSSDEVEASVIRLNRCTVLFHLQQLNSAKSLLESMYNGLESLEESVSIGLCLLLAEVLLSLSLPGRALAVVAHTEATFLPQPLPPQASSTKQLQADKDSRSPEKVSSKENVSKSITQSSGGGSGNSFNRTNILNSHTAGNDPISGSSEMRGSADQELLRGKLQLLRVRSLLQMRIVRVAKKELKAFVSHAVSSGNPLSVTLIMLKSKLEYLKGSYKKAIKVLNQCSAIPPPPLSFIPCLGAAYYNNLGIIHLALQKPTLACLYFQKALQELKSNTPKDNLKADSPLNQTLYSNGTGTGTLICYNLGITLMHLNKPTQAFDCLLEVARAHPTNPRLWLRLAECCIAVHKGNIHKESSQSFQQQTVGCGSMKRICILPNALNHDKKLSDQQTCPDPAIPVPTLEFARLCLRNCLELVPQNVSATFLTDEQEASGVLPDLYPSNPSCPMKGSQILGVKVRCLACSSYVALCLGDYLLAHRHAQTLLTLLPKLPQPNGVLKLLGHLYAGEALVLLGKTAEALSHFDPKQLAEIPLEEDFLLSTSSSEVNSPWCPLNGAAANKFMQYNLSVTFALRGQFEKANYLLREILDDPIGSFPTQVVLLALYLNLQLGFTDSVGALIERGLTSLAIV